ncbi:MAG: SIS domain-containing protein [bacterium]
MKTFKDYFKGIEKIVEDVQMKKVNEIIGVFWEAYKKDKQIFIFGNGGCAAASSHFTCDMAKLTITPGRRRFRVICLSANMSLLTAWANDTGYANIYGEQLVHLMNPGDVVIGLTGSGNSMNIINALKYANENGGKTIAITGFGGGMIKDIARSSLVVRSDNMQQVEDVYLMIMHFIALSLRNRVRADKKDNKGHRQ